MVRWDPKIMQKPREAETLFDCVWLSNSKKPCFTVLECVQECRTTVPFKPFKLRMWNTSTSIYSTSKLELFSLKTRCPLLCVSLQKVHETHISYKLCKRCLGYNKYLHTYKPFWSRVCESPANQRHLDDVTLPCTDPDQAQALGSRPAFPRGPAAPQWG